MLARAAALAFATLGVAGGVAGPALADDLLPLPLPSVTIPTDSLPPLPLPSLPSLPALPLPSAPVPQPSLPASAVPEVQSPATGQEGPLVQDPLPGEKAPEGRPAKPRERSPRAGVPAPATEVERDTPAARGHGRAPEAKPDELSPVAVGTGVGLVASGLVALAWPLRRGADED